MPSHGERGQLQAGDPAFGAGFQGGDILRRESEAHRPIEKLGCFGRSKAQICGAQLGHAAAGAEPGQGEARILAGGNDQVDMGRLMLEQKGEGVVDRFGLNHVVIVEHEDEAALETGDFIEQGGQHRFKRRRLGGLQRAQNAFAGFRLQGLQSRDEISQKAGGGVVILVQRKPGGPDLRLTPCADGRPLADQRCLARTGGGGNKGQFTARMKPLVEALDQAGAGDSARPGRGDVEFCGQNRRGHGLIITQ